MKSQDRSLISIERVVAFVLGPIVVAGSGMLSAWLSTKVGVKVTPAQVTGAFSTGGLAAGALAWKWLHGRQTYEAIEHDLLGVENSLGSSDSAGLRVTLKDLEGLAQSAAAHVISESSSPLIFGNAAPPPVGEGGASPPIAPIPTAQDPAPSSGGVAEQAADAGAATGQ